jgi:TRAP-type C4-dicarboxylate transport system substrate-binding protein
MTVMRASILAPAALVVTVMCAAAGCSAAQPQLEPVTLTLAHIDGGPELDPAVGWFVDRVAELSEGAITIEVDYGCCGATIEVEEELVGAVADGSAELGWVGTRVFGDLGVTATEPLTAPMLIDSYALQSAVLGSPEAATALAAIGELGVTPIALAPGTLRRPLAAAAPLLGPDDWSGLTVASFHSTQNAAAFAALGAVPVDVTFEERDQGLFDGTIDVLENSFTALDSDRESIVPYATANVVLAPRVSAIIGSAPAMERLGADGLAVLQAAASDVAKRAEDLIEVDAAAFASACDGGARFSEADAEQLAALEDRFAGIYGGLQNDPDAGALLRAILDLKGSVDAEPSIPTADCAGATPGTGAAAGDVSELNGSYRTVEHTVGALEAAGFASEDANGMAGAFTLSFDNGDFELLQEAASGDTFHCDGSYTVGGGRVTITALPNGDCGPGGRLFESGYAVDATQLVLSDLDSGSEADVYLFSSQPLTRVG